MNVASKAKPDARRVVLVGAGHAHLALILAADRFRSAGAELVIVDPGRFWYSGRASALLGGTIEADEDTVNIGELCAACGVRLITGRAVGLDGRERTVFLEEGQPVGYDLASFNVGSVVGAPFPVRSDNVWPVKPVSGLLRLRQALEAARRPISIIVVGGGASGCEIAANLAGLAERRRLDLHITLVGRGERLLPSAPSGAGAYMERRLRAGGCRLVLGRKVDSVQGQRVVLDDGGALAFDHCVLATGLVAAPLVGRLGLPVDPAGGLLVAPTLASLADARVFAAGDCAAIDGHPLPKVGVYGVRAAPVLLANLLSSLSGAPLRSYRPQRRFLSILDLGDGAGLALRGRLWFPGRAMGWWKRRLDGVFLAKYQRACVSARGRDTSG
ncbi:NAD(P)/FAD-dependent oxidoreductase [Consotaella salsifontis]|uniref:NADH dehydrogenase, FAD-containing subunit n=1 Tax=Consotaella salsifontis TaxID=1365950 RepID=A0A1T4RYI4_9HYPH|nr:FAD-dependent oxidoreductase [Consotaella salsifontis]SKA20641.1 NADH dehydrogenase, FAD-containing subunit [Consotaella salsifontis]